MSKFVFYLTRTRTLIALLVLTILLTLAFGAVMLLWDFQIIDEMYRKSTLIAHIDQLTNKQKIVHIWTSATLDVVYPFVYGALLLGTTLRTYSTPLPWLVLPSIVIVPVDLLEGLVQVYLLLGHEQYLLYKTVLTPFKLLLLVAAIGICLVGLIKTFKKRTNTNS